VEFTLEQAMKAQRESSVMTVFFFLISALDGGGWLTPNPSRFTAWQEVAEWALRSFWTSAVNLAFTGILFPDRPARSESLYGLY
jgi:hypothetical protein